MLDDSVLDKPYARRMDLVARQWSGKHGRVVRGIGLVTLLGLSAKNAILIVEFAEAAMTRGVEPVAAALEGARLRLRPIIMTSVAFIAGVVPLVIADGAGANGRRAIGTGVMGGMISATILAIFFVPMFFVLVKGLFKRKSAAPEHPQGVPA